MARRSRRRGERLVEELRRAAFLDPERPVGPVIFAGAAPGIFRALEIGQHVGVAPAFETLLPPQIVVARMAALIAHAVDRGAAAQELAARQRQFLAVELRLGLALIAPIEARIRRRHRPGDRQPQQRMTIGTAGFEQQDGNILVLGQARGDRATGRAGPDDDVVVSGWRSRANSAPKAMAGVARIRLRSELVGGASTPVFRRYWRL